LACSPRATCRTTSTARRSPARRRAAWPRSTRRNTSMPSRPSDSEWSEDFRRAVEGVQPLGAARRQLRRASPPPPLARQKQRDELAALAESLAGPVSVDDAIDSGEELVFLRDGLARQVLRKLRRGHWVVEDSLDL